MSRHPRLRRLNVSELRLMVYLDQAKRYRGPVVGLAKDAGLSVTRAWYALTSLQELGVITARATGAGVEVEPTRLARRLSLAPKHQ